MARKSKFLTRGSGASNWAREGNATEPRFGMGSGESASGIEASVGSKGDSYDDALAEAVNALFKTEVIYRRGPWPSL